MIASVCLTAAMAARRLDGVVGEVERAFGGGRLVEEEN